MANKIDNPNLEEPTNLEAWFYVVPWKEICYVIIFGILLLIIEDSFTWKSVLLALVLFLFGFMTGFGRGLDFRDDMALIENPEGDDWSYGDVKLEGRARIEKTKFLVNQYLKLLILFIVLLAIGISFALFMQYVYYG